MCPAAMKMVAQEKEFSILELVAVFVRQVEVQFLLGFLSST
jgi:hypothetical protein